MSAAPFPFSSNADHPQQKGTSEQVEPPRAVRSPSLATPARSDQAATEDHLNREVYARALAELIAQENTELPLTVGVYGAWGAGKSSFMLLIEEMLKQRRCVSVRFNPWRYNNADEIWSGLVLAIAPKIDSCLPWLSRVGFLLHGSGYREAIRKWMDRARAATKQVHNIVLVLLTSLGITLDRLSSPKPPAFLQTLLGTEVPVSVFTVLAIAAFLFLTAGKALQILLQPFTTQFDSYLAGYSRDQTRLRRLTHLDLGEIAEQFHKQKTTKRIVVFLDDLDRCPPDRILAVLEAINLFFEGLPLVTVLGVDARVVSRAVVQKYSFLLPSKASDADKERQGLSFLEKIVQIPFVLPPISETDRKAYVRHLLYPDDTEKAEETAEAPEPTREKRWPGLRGRLNSLIWRSLEFTFVRWLKGRNPTPDMKMSWSIQLALMRREVLTEEEKAWIESRGFAGQEVFRGYEKIMRRNVPLFSGFKLMALLKKARDWHQQELMLMAKYDSEVLERFLPWVRGNPRAIKRFINSYRLMKCMNLQLPGPEQARMEDLAAWLMLFQNWPQSATAVYAQAREGKMSDSDWPGSDAPQDMVMFIAEHRQALTGLCKQPSGFTMAGCFSFMPQESSPA